MPDERTPLGQNDWLQNVTVGLHRRKTIRANVTGPCEGEEDDLVTLGEAPDQVENAYLAARIGRIRKP